ncbi:hypothetical protein C3747_96g58 [Trypanosoma cruzi]|uniref:EF-hand domain-containing protein n=2 Tax=Trypanosoma cruzi TaxID=5693 RepID=Q4DHQ9_TRYCC|nr:hypothetical protein, conserved [Trypanosoma cruzi]EAN92056.1 hypothetical protein, conserved [Trypanosoma cruzi]PWV07919.1 hypothetical protein C3747_96g58 [Trypanosoma cruzi]RNC59631.1 hypothetical protein TcCL_ESM02691 [Trypanosoma cruzi]|eukprot:XP_813907.1 hypothetical protein [Trypanosoma cruzi strain CL Brener]
MPTEVVNATNGPCRTELMGQLISNCGCSTGSASRPSSAVSAVNRLVAFVDADSSASTTCSSADAGASVFLPPSTRISFDFIGVVGVSNEMLEELYDAFDVNRRGGVERSLMREMMKSGFSNYGAPCGDKDIDRLFERIVPYSVRRRKEEGNEDEDLMSFNEFCALFLSWLRL